MKRRASRSSGFALVTAIFVLVVLALLGAGMVALSTTQHVGQARDLLGTRAYFAARAGLEWGVYQVTATASLGAAGGVDRVERQLQAVVSTP